ncbi:hypothetical protein AB0G98_28015 [Streptomyces sp. NPDC020196]|uniref:hypothetical protein n=1 Tax=Streptomyces TaxID=1883 RepID=UPI0034089AFB
MGAGRSADPCRAGARRGRHRRTAGGLPRTRQEPGAHGFPAHAPDPDRGHGRGVDRTALDAPPLTVRGAAGPDSSADCTVSGTAEQLYLALWNRLPLSSLQPTGDRAVAALWEETRRSSDREAVGQRRPARTPGGPRRTSPGAPGRPSPAHA